LRFKLALEYDGTRYSGWQKQHNARTIQGEMIRAIEKAFEKTKGINNFIDLQGSEEPTQVFMQLSRSLISTVKQISRLIF
jgi:tRNA pseudouridine(38-40) synthase